MEFLGVIDEMLTDAGLNYEFGRKSEISYPYLVGSYQEIATAAEDGISEYAFYLDCFGKGKWLELEQIKAKIKQLFMEFTTVTDNDTGIAIDYESGSPVPIDTADYKHLQINLNIKEWSVNI